MSEYPIPVFSEMEKQILQEIMNIAFGSASGDLEDIIGISVILHIPDVKILPVDELLPYIIENLPLTNESTIVEEKFKGNFSGSGLLVFPEAITTDLLVLLSGKDELNRDDKEEITETRKEVFLEIGNILIGTCIGKITELLKTSASYMPPLAKSGDPEDYRELIGQFNQENVAIILKTHFSFRDHNLSGNLMIVTSHKSVIWMKNALNSFLEAYR